MPRNAAPPNTSYPADSQSLVRMQLKKKHFRLGRSTLSGQRGKTRERTKGIHLGEKLNEEEVMAPQQELGSYKMHKTGLPGYKSEIPEP